MNDMKTMVSRGKKLFEGEGLLVAVSLLGFLLAGICGGYVVMVGEVVLPEGNVKSAFSFNAAIAMFILSIAAIMPVSNLSMQRRKRVRWGLALTITIGYAIETIQHLRGYNPRFSREGTIMDTVIGGFFGLISLILLYYTVVLALSFFRGGSKHPRLTLSIRYAFLSTMVAFAAGIVMSIIQSRYTGTEGNVIVVHGLGFHALQALPILGLLLERSRLAHTRSRLLIHIACSSWMCGLIFASIQTVMGRTIFEWSLLPMLASMMLGIWMITTVAAAIQVFRPAYTRGTQVYDR